MKGYYRLVNAQFVSWLPFLAALCGAAIVAPLVLLHAETRDFSPYAVHERYEELFASSGSGYWFLLLFVLLLAFFLKSVYAEYWGSKSVYTLLTLPIRREAYYFSKLTMLVAAILLLIASELIAFRLGYALVASRAGGYEDGAFVMNNGWFLASIRSEFYRLLLPFGFSRLLSSLSMLLVIVTALYYGVLCERSRRLGGFHLIGIAVIVFIRVLAYRLNEELHRYEPSGLYISSLLLLAFSAFFIWHSLHMVKKGASA